MPIATKPDRVVTYNEELPSIKLQDPGLPGLARPLDKLNTLYVYYHKTFAIKLGKVVSCYKGLSCLKSNDPLKTWSHEVT